jgi:hypothetical protein
MDHDNSENAGRSHRRSTASVANDAAFESPGAPMSQTPPDTNQPSGLPFTPQDALEFMQKMWNPFGIPVPGFAPGAATGIPGAGAAAAGMPGGLPFPHPAAMFAAIDPNEVQRKIDELKIIEGWLQMSLNLMQMSIKTMELQKASLEAIRGSSASDSGSGKGSGSRRT